jgi:phosphoribosylamine--glycine ligase
MARHRVPTARFRVCHSANEALAVISSGEFGYPVVLKADGLAAGKGVVIAEDQSSAEDAVRAVMVDRRFGSAGDRIVFEEFLVGEGSVLFRARRRNRMRAALIRAGSQAIFDTTGDPNTGGHGVRSRQVAADRGQWSSVCSTEIVMPVLHGMEKEGTPFRGVSLCRLDADRPTVRR